MEQKALHLVLSSIWKTANKPLTTLLDLAAAYWSTGGPRRLGSPTAAGNCCLWAEDSAVIYSGGGRWF